MKVKLTTYLLSPLLLTTMLGCQEQPKQNETLVNQPVVEDKTTHFTFDQVAFSQADEWQQVKDVRLNASESAFAPVAGEGAIVNISSQGNDHPASNLLTANEYQDVHIEFDFNIGRNTWSGIYLLGRYRININNIYGKKNWWPGAMGGIHPRYDEEREWKQYDGVKATANPSKPVGEWQTLSIDFRAPRFDQNGLKTAYAEFINVKFNGVDIHTNQITTGPSQGSLFQNEATAGPIMIMGRNGPLAIRNLTIEERDFSSYQPQVAVKAEHQAPLDNKRGKPMLNLVEMGKKAFTNKGCKECHEVKKDAQSVKTGPSLFGVFANKPTQLTVIDGSNQQTTEVTADFNYFVDSIRTSTLHIATRKNADGSVKNFFPIMPSFNAEAINQTELAALFAYMQNLNDADKKGPDYVWQPQPEKPYVLMEDLTAELVSDAPRLARVNISKHTSGRAFHVGLPNHTNYTFDPRTLAIELIWSGRFLELKNEKQGRADSPSAIGRGAKLWPVEQLKNLFQPKLASGQWVDFSFKDTADLTAKVGKQHQNDAIDFSEHMAKVDAAMIAVKTPERQLPTFSYRVNQNTVELQLNIVAPNQLAAEFNFDNAQALQLKIPKKGLADINVSVGKVEQGVWSIPAGKHQQVRFTAMVENAAKIPELADNVPPQKNQPQALVWSEYTGKYTLPAGYAIESALDPSDKFGRRVLFEPLGIAFTDKGNAYVSTRTAGIWKVTNGKWRQFAEGLFDSMGVVVENEDQIVVGEKGGLYRYIDQNKDGWADVRYLVSNAFRFNSNYHEYLHGPIKLHDGSLMFNLNLGHGVPGGYNGGGMMATTGGYRGWALTVDKKGATKPFAFGLRSPAGLAMREDGKVFYTENQGDFHGTSKLYLLEQNRYYGQPVSLLDLPGKTAADPSIEWRKFNSQRALPVALLPHGRAMNSPGNPVWQTNEINFGPYKGQMFVGDQTQSNIFRVHVEEVNGVMQSALLPFMSGTASGAMRLTFNPEDNSMWVGQTGRGWWAKGGNLTALQRIVWDGQTIPQSIHAIEVTTTGYKLNFTQAIKKSQQASFAQLALSSWYYKEDFNYGSEELDIRDEKLSQFTWAEDGKSVSFVVENFAVDKTKKDIYTNRVYQFDLSKTAFAKGLDKFHSIAYYTLNQVPSK
ncbi:hypothetical protein DS2_14859 [Catenovulum agarivorans DS-2]|uniref:Cytochrome c domain-containing protein n=1 Tax=Catenovulum agarivorans DS-2 TaxID=1328313 RepID=W7Q836_9ALTE|nr:DUF1080 domain-containing protein [Catenovulum agarivorans]EWH08974.1 hypothetical protein DS2_14859 [Catenovulum agarivorans DS-2]